MGVELVAALRVQIDQLMAAPQPVMLYFKSPRCSVCHALLPKLMSAAADLSLPVVDVDVDQYPSVAGQFVVFTVPTVLVFHRGREMIRESRFISLEKIHMAVRQLDMPLGSSGGTDSTQTERGR